MESQLAVERSTSAKQDVVKQAEMNNDTSLDVSPAHSILLVDDHPLLRKGTRQLLGLEESLEVIGEVGDGKSAVKAALDLEPDLILLDLSMKGMDGIETLQALRSTGVNSRIVIFSVSDDRKDVVTALRAGADGYLLKDMEPDEILSKIQEACRGKMVLSEQLTEVLLTAFRDESGSGQELADSLTRRERQILKMIAEGMSNKMIGRQLDITEATVKVHVKHLLKKLGLRSRVEAAVWVVENNIR